MSGDGMARSPTIFSTLPKLSSSFLVTRLTDTNLFHLAQCCMRCLQTTVNMLWSLPAMLLADGWSSLVEGSCRLLVWEPSLARPKFPSSRRYRRELTNPIPVIYSRMPACVRDDDVCVSANEGSSCVDPFANPLVSVARTCLSIANAQVHDADRHDSVGLHHYGITSQCR